MTSAMRATSLSVPEASVFQCAACSLIGDESKAYTSKQRLRRSCKTHPAGCLDVLSACPSTSHDGGPAYGCQLASLPKAVCIPVAADSNVCTSMGAHFMQDTSLHMLACPPVFQSPKSAGTHCFQRDFAVCHMLP